MLRQAFRARAQQIQHAIAIKLRFERRHVDDEMRVRERLEFRHAVVQRRKIVGGDVVGVFFVGALGELPAVVVLAQPQQILRELALRGQKIRLKIQRAPLRRRAFRKAIFLRQFFSDEIIHLRDWFDKISTPPRAKFFSCAGSFRKCASTERYASASG